MMSKANESIARHKKIIIVIFFVFFVFLGGAAFPIYNLNKEWSTTLTLSILVSAIGYSGMLGTLEVSLFPKAKIHQIVLLNFVLILFGMGCRYLLEYGEVSNTYNFTVPNMFLHVVVTLIISTVFWCKTPSNKE